MGQEKELTMADFEDKLDYDSFEAPKWLNFLKEMDEKTNIKTTIVAAVKGGFDVEIDEVKAFLPISRASLSHIEDPEKMIGQEVTVRIIEVDRAINKLVVSAREVLKEEQKLKKAAAISAIKVGDMFNGTIDSIMDFGVFVKREDGISGLLHISQISHERVKHPKDVYSVGDSVETKVIKNENGKLSLSIKALTPSPEEIAKAEAESIVIPEAENIGTNLGDLLKGIEL